jgi:glycosyltransferase involved in cell wall biosynthesis
MLERRNKILLFIDWYLPGYRAGGPIRSCANLIAHLSSYFDISVVTRDTDYTSDTPYEDIVSNEWNISPEGTRVFYFSSERLSRESICGLLKAEEYDFLYLNSVFSRYFTLIPLQYLKGTKNKKIIVASRGMLASSALAIKKNKKRLFLFFAKRFDLFGGVLFHASNEMEATSIRNIFGPAVKVHIAPNLPEKSDLLLWTRKIKSGELLKLVSIARIAPEKNIKYALEILKEVKVPVQYDLYGSVYNENYWDACKRTIHLLPSNIRVNFMNSIESQKVSEVLTRYDFLFLPTQGENFGHVILQSMMVGVPVIISDATSWKQLEEKKAGWDIPLFHKEEFVSVIEKCASMSQHEYDVVSKGAFDFASLYVHNKELIELSKQLFLK